MIQSIQETCIACQQTLRHFIKETSAGKVLGIHTKPETDVHIHQGKTAHHHPFRRKGLSNVRHMHSQRRLLPASVIHP